MKNELLNFLRSVHILRVLPSAAAPGRIQDFHGGGGGGQEIMCAYPHYEREVPYGRGPGPGSWQFFMLSRAIWAFILKHFDTKWDFKIVNQIFFFGGGGRLLHPRWMRHSSSVSHYLSVLEIEMPL